ncbi:MAG: cyclic-di-AMP receptor [Oscillospiraceae bacterium]|nr:cyclic-di-AMP receptor [Oscillospiraceae bacterium]
MKLILAIINHDDAHGVIQNLTQAGYHVTKLATTGGFLQVGNVTILIGVDDERLEGAMEIIGKRSNSRRQVIPATSEMGMGMYSSMPVEVTVGGATAFVMNVEDFKKF